VKRCVLNRRRSLRSPRPPPQVANMIKGFSPPVQDILALGDNNYD